MYFLNPFRFLLKRTTACLFVFACISPPPAGQAAEPLDTEPGKRLVELIKVVGTADKEQRDRDIVPLFTDDEDPDELREMAGIVFEQTGGGIAVQEVKESHENRITVIAKTDIGPLLEIQLQISKSADQRITNLHFGRYDTPQVAKPIGNLIPIFTAAEKTLPAAQGTWLAKGYGYVIHVTDSDVEMYDYTGTYGWKMEEDEDKLALLFEAGDSDDQARMTYHAKEPGFNLIRLEALPTPCLEKTEWTQSRLFDLFTDIMTTHYPFFEQRNIDWQAKIDQHRPQVSDAMSDTELFDVMESMLLDLNDGHTGLSAEIEGVERNANTGHSKTIRRLRDAFDALPEPKSRGNFFGTFFRKLDKAIMTDVLHGEGHKTCANQIKWGFAHPKVGYLNIDGMGGFALGDTDTKVKVLHEALDEILTALAETDAIIIDITTNGGGSDLYSIEIASHFTDQKRLGFSKWPAKADEYRNDRYVTPYTTKHPEGVTYTKPIYLMTNDYTASAAEIFTMCMRAMPQVTTVGTSTSGALSDVLFKSLPNGWEFHTSNEIYVDHEGVCHEGPGIPPEVPMDIFDPENILNVVHHETVQKVVELAIKNAEATIAAGAK
jgi:carboxyl-terminal processing protease